MGVVVLIGRAGLWSRSTGCNPPTKIEPSTLAPVSCARLFLGSNCLVGETLVICPRLEVEGSERPGGENITGCKISTCSLCYSKEKDGGRMQLRRSSYERFPQQAVALWAAHVTGGVCAAEPLG
ncbi:uncharacterized protein K441DRAFT_189545 [Cenococcum geophilum 1.58]|uniref:uncharacterized protein n=1 Tax=Cenococcum geophilum 1.58 TaxID=794803 RepID=UPI00358FCB8B|nr:hypothetical protein K441DRAFT_189545 [Cenococcum geophilum 1.58]